MKNLTLGLAYEAALKVHNGELKTEEELSAYVNNRISERKQQVINSNKRKRENMKNFIKNRRKK